MLEILLCLLVDVYKRQACHSRTVQEDMIGLATVDAINKLLGQKDDFLITLKENIETVISETDNNLVYEIDKRLEELQKDLLRLANSKEDYNDIADEIYRLRDERHKVLACLLYTSHRC